MRHSNHSPRERGRSQPTAGLVAPVALLLVMSVLIGCGPTAAASAPPTPLPTPAITPDPHLKEPVTADQVWIAIASAHLRLTPNNATISEGTIVKRINADLEGWTLRITAYTNAAAMQKAKPWKSGAAPGVGEAAYNFAAMNVIVEFGPTSRASAPSNDPEHQATAATLISILDPLLWPIEQHSVTAIPSRTVPPPATPAPTPTKSPAPAKSKAP
jgi:hypothetical protein